MRITGRAGRSRRWIRAAVSGWIFVWQKRFKQDKALAHVRAVLGAHWSHPPALDDTRRIKPLLEESEHRQRELLAGRIIAGEVREVGLH